MDIAKYITTAVVLTSIHWQ
ncbi:hypothetical protein [Bacteroides thetaiotaomicron]|nr:hypothetical protein [Bacteroides thetaiotaomicron]